MLRTEQGASELSFEEEARQVILELKHALGDLMEALPIGPGAGPTEIARTIKIDTKLAWKISHLLELPDPFEAARYLPGMAALRRFLDVAAKHRPPDDVLRAIRDACKRFEEMVRSRAGSRRSLDLMLAGLARNEQPRVEMEQRKAAYLANSFLWGVQAQAQLKTAILAPSVDPLMVDGIVINGFIGLRRIRNHVPWRITPSYSVDDRGNVRTDFTREPLEPAASTDPPGIRPPLLTRFCSYPLPKLEPIEGTENVVDFALSKAPLGHSTSDVCLIGEIVRGAEPRYRQPDYEYNAVYIRLRTPCEVAVLDVLVHRDLFGEVRYRPRLFSDLFTGELLTRHLECDELTLQEGVDHLGTGIEMMRLPVMPRYREMLGFAFDRAGWRCEEFDAYRISLEYPTTPTDLVVRTRLPRRPSDPE